jgi:U3 small nucleolar RNA-associated protein 13
MASRPAPKTTFEVDNVIQPIYTGGSIGLDSGARILASTLGEDVVLTELSTGRRLAEIEGDGEPISTLTSKIDLRYSVSNHPADQLLQSPPRLPI